MKEVADALPPRATLFDPGKELGDAIDLVVVGTVRAKSFILPERQCRILPPLIFLSFSVTFRAG